MRGDSADLVGFQLHYHFNSRPCVRGDPCSVKDLVNIDYFNSRPCVRGDLLSVVLHIQHAAISIHAPA